MTIELIPGQLLGDYELLGPAGAGGFSVVWQARRVGGEELVAIKVPQVEQLVEHLRQEATLTRRVDDPQVAPILEAHLDHDPPFLVLPWIGDGPLEPPREVPSPLVLAATLERVLDLTRVLARVHAKGVVHGDLKPGNVLLRPDGKVVLCDLGLARLQVKANLERSLAQSLVSVDGRSLAGTLDYMAPELFEGQEPSAASDLYALGVLLHHLLTGRPPAFGVSAEEVNPYLTPGAEGLLRWLLQPDPARRPASAEQVARVLARLLRAEERCLARRNGHERRRVFERRMRVLRRGARALLVAVAGAAALLALGWTALAIGTEAGPFGRVRTLIFLTVLNPIAWVGLVLGITTINAWIAGVPDGVYKKRPGHPIWSFMMQ